MTVETSDKLLLSAAEAASTLGISRSAFYSLLSSGRIGPVGIRLGRSVRWSIEEIKDWLLARDTRTGSLPNRERWLAMKGDNR
jgi:excisionase family DNA binding protein